MRDVATASVSRRLLIAFVVSLALVLAAPLLGEWRSWLRARFPGQIGLILNGGVLVLAAAAILAAVARVRERRAPRYAAIALAAAIAVAASGAAAGTSAAANAAERFHFIAYGAVTWLFYRAFERSGAADPSSFILPAVCALLVSVADEAFQWFVPARVGELRDVWLNASAILAGLIFSLGVSPPRQVTGRVAADARRVAGAVFAIAIVAIAGFVHLVHLGYAIEDEETGLFRSRFTAARLRELAADRAAAWRATPPPRLLVRLSREDQYLAEAIWHIQARNAAWETDIRRAWHENLILERYFAPALDTPSYAVPEVSRWPPAQHEDAARRAGAGQRAAAAPGVSHAEPLPIWTVPPMLLWAAALGAALTIGIFSAHAPSRPSPMAHHP